MGMAPGGANRVWDWSELSAVAFRETMRILRNRPDAEDASQEAIARAYRAHSRCTTPDAPNHWMRTIARREAYRLYTHQRATELLPATSEEYRDDLSESVHARIAAEIALEGSTATERAILLRRYVLDQTSSQIGQDLGLPAVTVRVQLHRATKRIHERASAAS
jgi:RNA polymerase sigma-70 factor (ECF subfamily)